MKKKLSFRDKLADPKDFPKVQPLTRGMKRRHGATVACPIVTGIFARIVAGAAGENEAEGLP